MDLQRPSLSSVLRLPLLVSVSTSLTVRLLNDYVDRILQQRGNDVLFAVDTDLWRINIPVTRVELDRERLITAVDVNSTVYHHSTNDLCITHGVLQLTNCTWHAHTVHIQTYRGLTVQLTDCTWHTHTVHIQTYRGLTVQLTNCTQHTWSLIHTQSTYRRTGGWLCSSPTVHRIHTQSTYRQTGWLCSSLIWCYIYSTGCHCSDDSKNRFDLASISDKHWDMPSYATALKINVISI